MRERETQPSPVSLLVLVTYVWLITLVATACGEAPALIVRGVVRVLGSGRPVNHAHVQAFYHPFSLNPFWSDGCLAETYSDADGNFSLFIPVEWRRKVSYLSADEGLWRPGSLSFSGTLKHPKEDQTNIVWAAAYGVTDHNKLYKITKAQ